MTSAPRPILIDDTPEGLALLRASIATTFAAARTSAPTMHLRDTPGTAAFLAFIASRLLRASATSDVAVDPAA